MSWMNVHRHGWLVLGVSVLAGCQPLAVDGGVRAEALRETGRSRPVPVVSSGTGGREELVPEVRMSPVEPCVQRLEGQGISAVGFAFDSRNHCLVVCDQAQGPGTRYRDARDAGEASGALAAVNGGFFLPGGQPLGLVISAGRASGRWNGGSSLGAGVWYLSKDGAQGICARSRFDLSQLPHQQELLQAGPMLVADGRLVAGLDRTKRAPRTMLVWDGSSRWWIGQTSSCSLDEVARWLHASRPMSWPVRQALNLDGGSSCDLWVSGQVAGGPVLMRSWFAKPVRNVLLLRSR